MAGKFLLDTNVIIALFSGDKHVSQRVAQAEVFVPSTALGELYYGARKSVHATQTVYIHLYPFELDSAAVPAGANSARP